jgi:hypothetical protein
LAAPALDDAADELTPRGLAFAFVYTNEAHPSDEWPHHASFDQKLRHAREMASRHGIRRRMLVDDLDGTVHRAYGTLPNMTLVLHRGRILYRASWTDPAGLVPVLREIAREEALRQDKKVLVPYRVEWTPRRVRNQETFLRAMETEIGRRAVDDFIAATRATWGDAAARALESIRDRVRGPETGP